MSQVLYAKGFQIGVQIDLSPTIQNEWQTRCIGDVIPALADYAGEASVLVDHAVLEEIKADCRFHMDPKAIDATAGERSAYRALLRRCEDCAT